MEYCEEYSYGNTTLTSQIWCFRSVICSVIPRDFMICTETLLIRDNYAIQRNNMRHFVATAETEKVKICQRANFYEQKLS